MEVDLLIRVASLYISLKWRGMFESIFCLSSYSDLASQRSRLLEYHLMPNLNDQTLRRALLE